LKNLPNNLHTLTLGYAFNQKLDELPHNLSIINIFNKYNMNSLQDKYILEVIDKRSHRIINIKGIKGMFTKSSNKF